MSRDIDDRDDTVGDTEAIENVIEADADIDSIQGSVVAVVAVAAEDGAVSAVLDGAFDDIVTDREPVADGQRVGLSCRGSAERTRDLVAALESADGVEDVTVTVLRVRD